MQLVLIDRVGTLTDQPNIAVDWGLQVTPHPWVGQVIVFVGKQILRET